MQVYNLLQVDSYAGVIVRSLGILFSACYVSTALASSSADAWLDSSQQERLDRAIVFYEEIAGQGGWETLQNGSSLSAGMREERVRLLRRRLRASGDFDDERMGADPLLFDVALTEAVISFQSRHGLGETGVVDHLTRQRLNLTPRQLLNRLRDSRARWEELPVDKNMRRVWVNIPEASVTAIARGKIDFSVKGIVGHPTRQTPQLSSTIKRIVVNPSWSVPRSITIKDFLPRQQADPTYVTRNNIRVFKGWGADMREVDPQQLDWKSFSRDHFPYHLRQDPGPTNSLGRYKFDFPNEYDVYLHDTPVQTLLDLSYRTLSSGCVRVEDSPRLAQWLAADAAGPQLVAAEASGFSESRSVALQDPVSVDLVYLTAWVGLDDRVRFRSDVYQLVVDE